MTLLTDYPTAIQVGAQQSVYDSETKTMVGKASAVYIRKGSLGIKWLTNIISNKINT